MRFSPFTDGDTFATFGKIVKEIEEKILSLDNEYVLKASPVELEDYYVDKVTIHPLIFHADRRFIENRKGTKVDVSYDFRRDVFPGERAMVQGTRLDIAIPYEGDSWLWKVRASTYSLSGYPEIEVRSDAIVLSFSFPDDSPEPERLKSEIEREIKTLSEAVQNLNRDIENHNKYAPQMVRDALLRKRQMAEAGLGAVTALEIPIKLRGEPLTFIAPVKRRTLPIRPPRVPTGPYTSEPVLDEIEYQHILQVMRSMSLVIERNPVTFSSLGEEAIRDHFLLQLNGHYEGGATGETFNASGKTDILIRADSRNIFIAECKFWRGSAEFNQGVDQLLGYLSWRDTKGALVIFNKTKDSSSVVKKMHGVMEAHPEYRRTVFHDPDGDSRYIFVKDSDPGREIIITTQLYDMSAIKQKKSD